MSPARVAVSGHTGFAPLTVCAFPVYTAQAPGCSIWSGPCVACGSSFPVLHKRADSVGPAFCAFPGLSSSGSQEPDKCTLPGAVHLLPSAAPASVSTHRLGPPCVCSGELVCSRDPPGGCQPSRISESLWLEAGSLFAVSKGMPSLGPSLPLSPPPASCLWRGMGLSAAG